MISPSLNEHGFAIDLSSAISAAVSFGKAMASVTDKFLTIPLFYAFVRASPGSLLQLHPFLCPFSQRSDNRFEISSFLRHLIIHADRRPGKHVPSNKALRF